MAKMTIFYASVNPSYYDVEALTKMKFDEAVDFFEKDTLGACTTKTIESTCSPKDEMRFFSDGADKGDTSDSLLLWIKFSNQ